ncbi:hypothetical protein DYB36_006503 [Aphanomyces astaci]|uniref:Fe/B12 periplasmic-binding domain-containing protein n=2 Tax=Aphanomyces astaci TaxID=112090 RepID=A0A397A6M6_APHAT|nr:hypothetical protein DYB36_006503 [Aphanomyces astaci]
MAVLRVVSLLPSATELLHFLLVKLNARHDEPVAVLVGRSHECDWPEEYAALPVLTSSRINGALSCAEIDRQVRDELAAGVSLYTVDTEMLLSLRPDLVVTQSLCQVCTVDYAMVVALLTDADPCPRILDTNPSSFYDVFQDIHRLADALGAPDVGHELVTELQARVDAILAHVVVRSSPPRLKIGFCEWTDPIFCGGHWTPQMIEMAGAAHPLNNTRGPGKGGWPSRTISPAEFVAMDPDVIVVAPCGMDLDTSKKETAAMLMQPWWTPLRGKPLYVVNGNHMFNRPGPRLVDALEWLVSIVHPASTLSFPDFPAERYPNHDAVKTDEIDVKCSVIMP